MRGTKTALIVGIVLVTAVSASMLRAQQGVKSGSAPATDDPPSTMTRSARQLLRNGLDYLDNYHDYDRALTFFRDVEARQGELSDAERQKLSQGIERARRGLREGPAMARVGRPVSRPGALARAAFDEPVRKASAEVAEPAPLNLPDLPPVAAANPAPAPAPQLTPTPTPQPAPAPDALPPPALEPVANLPLPAPAPEPEAAKPVAEPPAGPAPIVLTAEPPAIDPAPAPLGTEAPIASPPVAELPLPDASPKAAAPNPAPVALPEPAPAPAPPAEVAAPPIRPMGNPAVIEPPTSPSEPPEIYAPPIRSGKARTQPVADAPASSPAVADVPSAPPAIAEPPASTGAPAIELPPAEAQPTAASPSPAPAADLDVLPPLPSAAGRALREPDANPVAMSTISDPQAGESAIHPDTLREVEEIARRETRMQRDNPRPNPLGTTLGGSNSTGDTASASSKAFQLPRAPSPTEPRPIRAIPVPEDFVLLPKREFEPNRKYWVAAATCHMPLYFQDAALERYGQGVEQSFGPAGRFLSYPLDDPTQTNQRNQLIQPMYSAGLFLVQFATLPYNLVMDPPWEAEYDLGYPRPGDRVPRNTYYFPLTGVGPPLKGNDYGKPKPRKGWFLPILSH